MSMPSGQAKSGMQELRQAAHERFQTLLEVRTGGMLFDQAHEWRCRPPRHRPSRQFGDMLRARDAEAHGQRKIGHARACAAISGLTLDRDGLLLAGDAGARDQIDEAARILRDQLQASVGAGGRGQKYGVETGGAHDVHVRAGFFDAGVGEQAAVDAARLWRRVARRSRP